MPTAKCEIVTLPKVNEGYSKGRILCSPRVQLGASQEVLTYRKFVIGKRSVHQQMLIMKRKAELLTPKRTLDLHPQL